MCSALPRRPQAFLGYPVYIPAPLDITGQPIEDEKAGYDLSLITFREISQTKSRTPGNYWLSALLPENTLLIDQQDANRLGLKAGETEKWFQYQTGRDSGICETVKKSL